MKANDEYSHDYFKFLHAKVTKYSKLTFDSKDSCKKAFHNIAMGFFGLTLNNTDYKNKECDLFGRDVEFEKVRLKELYIALKKYTLEFGAVYNGTEKENYDFTDGVGAFVHGILEITDTETVVLNNSYKKTQGYCVAFAGDCLAESFDILTNEWY